MAEDNNIPEGWPILEVWSKYEQIAMHFNDLLMRLRTQALAGVAALATIIGVFANAGLDPSANWLLVSLAFLVLSIFWIAIWMLDFLYYNRLLLGAAEALFALEGESNNNSYVKQLNMSTTIAAAVKGIIPHEGKGQPKRWKLVRGRWFFYSLVFVVLISGFMYATYKHYSLESAQISSSKNEASPPEKI